MFYTAEESAKIIAEYVGSTWPENKDKLYRILTLVNKRIWKEGTWWGMYAEFFVKARIGPEGEYYIPCPPGYDVLKAVNVDGSPKMQRDTLFQFHKNAYGTIEKNCGNWTNAVVDLGEHPTINDIYICQDRPGKILIGARLTGKETGTNPAKIIRIEGDWDRGGRVWTYEKETWADRKIEALNEEEAFNPVFGAKIALNDKIRFVENIWWKNITNITKDITTNPVEVYAFHEDQTLQLLTTIEPHQKISKNRRYLVPDTCLKACSGSCSCACSEGETCTCDNSPLVHAIFKRSEPEAVTYDTQEMYTRDNEALISLAIAMQSMYTERKPEEAVPYLLNGVKALEDNNRENQSNSQQTIQVTGPLVDDIPELVRWRSH